jgi:hypothetical protein
VKNLFAVVVLAVAWMVCGGGVNAQATPPSEGQHVISSHDLDLLRQDLRSTKKQLVAQNLKLSDTEATKFWPVYDKYTAELIKINDKKYALIQSYADQWATMTDEQALSFAHKWIEMDTAISQLRQKYVPIVSQVLTGRNTATFFQLDRRISMMIDLQLASQMPVVNGRK